MCFEKMKMKKTIFLIAIIFTLIASVSCAKRGTITGGKKDTIPPTLIASIPKNFSKNFSGKEIKLIFDEYVKIKNLNKQLIVSPPLKNPPEVLPINPSKTLTIKIKDTLAPNTTYSFNFGQSIQDNNENNPLNQFKFVFSTGNYIDSLAIKVKVKDALEKKVDNFVSVMLYEANEKFNDSTIYKQAPRYITNTLDSLKIVSLENIKAGKYFLVALKDNGNNKFDPKVDKIGFQKQFITIPSDTIYELELFKETLPFKPSKPFQASKNRIVMGYEGNTKDVNITLKNGKESLPSIITKFPKKDSLQVWFNPLKTDSLQVEVKKEKFFKHFNVKIKNQKKDTLSLSSEFTSNLPLRERFNLTSSTPLIKFDKSKISVLNKDSLAVSFTTEYEEMNQKLYLNFERQPQEKYKISFLPGAIKDFFEKENDTLSYSVSTKNTTEYGNLKVILNNIKKFPILLQLTDKEGKVKATEYTEKNNIVEFIALEPELYTLRIIYDDNKNRIWDAGDYLKKQQSEEVIYFPKPLDVRANWDVEQPFDLK